MNAVNLTGNDSTAARADRARSVGRSRRPSRVRTGGAVAPVLWMAVLALFIVGVGVLPAAGDPVPSQPTATIAVRVSPSDTLWTIAEANRLPGLTTAQMVKVIREANSLTGGALGAGAILRVPARSDSGTAYAQATASTDPH